MVIVDIIEQFLTSAITTNCNLGKIKSGMLIALGEE